MHIVRNLREVLPDERHHGDQEADASVAFDYNFCKGCGVCAEVCPKKCIAMVPEDGGKK